MLKWFVWRARKRINSRVRLWYHQDYAAPNIAAERRVANLQTDRAERAILRLQEQGLVHVDDIVAPRIADFDDLARVHTPDYLTRVVRPEILGAIFGLETDLVDVDPLLLAQRRTVGGTIEAAEAAASGQVRIAFNLGGGLHHAAPDQGAGFCVFNDVAVAIARLRHAGYRKPIAIVDFDFHQGDGNLAAFETDSSVLVFSIHGTVWTERVSPACRNILLPSGTSDADYLACLEEHLPAALASHGAKLIFYLAGADVLADDQLGDFAMSTKGVLRRDRRVVEIAEGLGASVVITMSGGYSPSAWQCSSNFIRWLLTDVTRVDRHPHATRRYRFSRVARTLDPWELQRDGGEIKFNEDDVFPEHGLRRSRPFLDYYSLHGLEFAFERYGLFPRLRNAGFSGLRVSMVTDDPSAQRLRVEGSAATDEGAGTGLLIELVLSRQLLRSPERVGLAGQCVSVLRVEWLLLQNPWSNFTPARCRLPGQQHPGLGLAHDVHELLVIMCGRLHLEGLTHCPAHYHNAVVATREYRFIAPVQEGRFRAVRRVLANFPLCTATDYIDKGRLVLADGTRFVWVPGELLLPVSERLKSYFESTQYAEHRDCARDELLAAGPHVANPQVRPTGQDLGEG